MSKCIYDKTWNYEMNACTQVRKCYTILRDQCKVFVFIHKATNVASADRYPVSPFSPPPLPQSLLVLSPVELKVFNRKSLIKISFYKLLILKRRKVLSTMCHLIQSNHGVYNDVGLRAGVWCKICKERRVKYSILYTHTSHAHACTHKLCHQPRAHTSSNGLSDPFCKVLVDGKVKGQTTVQEAILNPGVCGGCVLK
jgi:hypothetical protein